LKDAGYIELLTDLVYYPFIQFSASDKTHLFEV